jgi:hypothetical protein
MVVLLVSLLMSALRWLFLLAFLLLYFEVPGTKTVQGFFVKTRI